MKSAHLHHPEGRWRRAPISPEPGANPGIDVVFPVLHGTFGEDGTVQGLLELAGSAVRRRRCARLGRFDGQRDDEARSARARPAGRGVRRALRGEPDLDEICSRCRSPCS